MKELGSIRTKKPPVKTGIGYKVFYLKNGKLYPPMVNPTGEDTKVGIWLDADAAPIVSETKTGRPQVKQGGKGTKGGSGKLAYRPGWHLGLIPYAIQFNKKDKNGRKTLFPKNFVWAEVEYAKDKNYQKEAESFGYSENGKYRHSYAGLPYLPTDGYYKYRTNPNPKTDEWIITGAMKINKILTKDQVDEIVIKAGRRPQKVEGDSLSGTNLISKNMEGTRTKKKKLTAKQLEALKKGREKLKREKAKAKKEVRKELNKATKSIRKKTSKIMQNARKKVQKATNKTMKTVKSRMKKKGLAGDKKKK